MKRNIFITLFIALFASLAARGANFKSEEIYVINPLDGVRLNGTLTLPAAGSPKALLVLATGSGLQDRDETVGGHKPFKELAEYLAENGYAVVRTDDRGYGFPPDTALIKRSTQWDELGDYRAVMDAMRKRPDLKGLRAGFLGHSAGGTEAVMSFSKDRKAEKYNSIGSNPDFIITLAGATMPGDSVVLSQVQVMSYIQGVPSQFDILAPKLKERYKLVKSDMPEDKLRTRLYSMVTEGMPDFLLTPQLRSQIDRELDVMCSPYYREMLRYDPAKDIRRVNVPWLAMFGSKDTQVVAKPNSEYLKKHLGKKNKVTVTVLDGKNHLFQNAISGLTTEYDMIPEDISEDTLQEILEWLEMTL